MYNNNFGLHKTIEYQEWFEDQTLKSQVQILNRLSKIQLIGYFGDHKYLTEGLWELKWVNGRRIYYAYLLELDIVIVLGGNKNGQDRDIAKARKIFKKYQEAF